MRFDSYHPAINFIFFGAALAMTVFFNHPVFLVISYLTSFAYSVKLSGRKTVVFNLILIPLMAAWALWYSSYNHFGVTELSVNLIGNTVTVESLVYGGVIAVIAASVIMWFSCIHTIISTDKVIYLFGKVSPRFSLYFSILLRMVPHIKARAKKISAAQRCIGRGARQGNLFRRMHNFFRIMSIIITWTLESFAETSDSMRSRGYTLKGRTAFSIYRFDNRDRSFVTGIFWCLIVILMGVLLDQTRILYNPEIIMNRITPVSIIFYAAYAAVCLLPMALQMAGEYRFKKLREGITDESP